jgi:hypothetical protein
MQYLGDYKEDYATLNFKFSTHKADGTPIALVDGVISVYKADGTSASTDGITLTADFNSKTGLNHVLIDLSSHAFYAIANDYQVVITAGTVDSISVIGIVVAQFSIENRFNEVDVTKVDGDAAAATMLKKSILTVLECAVEDSAFTPTATEFETASISDADVDGLVGRTIFFNSGDRNHEPTVVVANSIVAGKMHFTVSPALPGAPADGDTFLLW